MLRECNQAHPKMAVGEMLELIRNAPPGPWPHRKDDRGVDVHADCWAHWAVTKEAFRLLLAEHVESGLAPHPGHYRGRGVVICGGGERYFPGVWVCLRKLRHAGCRLPVQVWHLGPAEMDPAMARLLARHGAECVDARAAERLYPARVLCGWELKGYAALLCPFEEVLVLDADNAPLRNVEYLFECREYRDAGAAFWPDFDHGNYMGRLAPSPCEDLGIPWRDAPSFESGQFLVNKARCWNELLTAWWILEHSDYYFRHFYGDKEAFHVAWERLGTPYAMPAHAPGWEHNCVIVQHDWRGNRLFLHRCQDKWRYGGGNRRCEGLEDEALHWSFVEELRQQWGGRAWHNDRPSAHEKALICRLAGRKFLYRRLPEGDFKGDERVLELLPGGRVGEGAADCERRWEVNEVILRPPGQGLARRRAVLQLTICREDRPTCHLAPANWEGPDDTGGAWTGVWLEYERCPVLLVPLDGPRPETDQAAGPVEKLTGLLRAAGYAVTPGKASEILKNLGAARGLPEADPVRAGA